jgi:PAS domain S-box-containing protein
MADDRILIVEDEGIEALDLQHRLIGLGYPAPDIAFTAEEAVQKAGEAAPDLVLMDIMLHGETDGVTAAARIQALFDIPIIYITAYADEETLQRAKITEPYGYLVKPYKERELHITIDVALYKHRMERKLKESEKWLATTLRCIGDAVIATDQDGRITFMNAVAEGLMGWKLEEVRQRELTEVFHIINRDTRRPVENPVSRVLLEGTIVGLANHTRLIARDGSETPIDDSAAPIKDDKGSIIGVVLVFRDVTERERALQEIHRSHDELEKRVRERTAELAAANDRANATNALLNLFVKKTSRKEYLDALVRLIQNWSGCRHAGIRVLDEGGCIPYEGWIGFDPQFMESECWLSARQDQCICSRVIAGRPDRQDLPAMTPAGSFRCDNTVRFVGGLSEAEQTRYRGVCIRKGFLSLSVVPISYRKEILAAVHLADEREGQASAQVVEFIESVAPLIGEAIYRFKVEKSLRQAYDIQTTINSLLRLSLEKLTLEELLQRALDLLIANPWIAAEPRGCIFLVDEDSGHLVMKAQKGLSDSIQKRCARVPIGKCLCGRAALMKQLVYSECGDSRHEMAEEIQPPHAHYLVSILAGDRVLGLIGLYMDGKRRSSKENETALEAFAATVAGIIVRKRGEQALRESESRLRMLSSELLKAQESERKRIARELHDSIVSSLSAVSLSIEGILAQGKRGKEWTESLHTLTSIVQRAITEIRRIIADLRPSVLDDLGAAAAMDWLCREFQKVYSHIRVERRVEAAEEEIPDALKTAIFRISQEALNNVAKYSRADLVEVSLRKRAGRIELVIRDNGQGFHPQSALSADGSRKGLGLISMRERTELSGGSFAVESAEGAGAAIRASWPLVREDCPAVGRAAPAGSAGGAFPQESRALKALLVEDNAVFRQSFKAGLQVRFPSMVIEEAADGDEVIPKVRAFLPHLIFMDIQLPGQNGLQLTREIRSRYPDAFIMVMTGQDAPEYRKAALEQGADCFVKKDSLNWGEIEEAIRSLSLRMTAPGQ